jgi:RNA polymerase sigma-70 factor (ECF subfamily)
LKQDIFEKIYKEYYRYVYRYIYSLTFNQQRAEDLTQDVFVKAFCVLEFPNERIKAWLLTVAHNLYVDYIKKNKREMCPGDDVLNQCSDKDVHNAVDDREELSNVISQIKILPETQRQAVVLCLINELSYEDAADIMGLSVSAVTNLIYRARKTLRKVRRVRNE